MWCFHLYAGFVFRQVLEEHSQVAGARVIGTGAGDRQVSVSTTKPLHQT